MRTRLLIIALSWTVISGVHAQVPITTSGDTATITFSGFAGLGFSPSPVEGELSSNTWSINGETDSLVFGGTRNTPGTIFARGVVGSPQLSAGFYAYSIATDTMVMIQPTSASYSPGTITLRIQNNTGSSITSIYFGYHFFVRNDGARGNSFNLLHSSDNTNYITVPSLDYTSPDAVADTNIIDLGIKEVVVTGINVPNGGFYYFRWYTNDVSGSSNRDEFFFDNIKIVGTVGVAPNAPPTIASVVRSAFVPNNAEPLTVSAWITDDHGLAAQRLIYSVNGLVDSVSMTNAGADSFTAVIPSDSNLNGNLISYFVRAYDDSGAVSTSASSAYLAGVTRIFMVRQNDGNGVNIYNGYAARVTGIVTAETGIFSTTARDFQIQDGTRGINVFLNNTSLPTVARGDSIVVEGTIAQFNGKLEITTPSLNYTTVASGLYVGAMSVTVSQMSESLEGTLIRIEGTTKTSGTWPGTNSNATLYISDNGGVDTTGLFIDRDTDIDGTPEPFYPATFTGIASQFDNASPFTGGYQIVPRDLNDIQGNQPPAPAELISPVDQAVITVSDSSTGNLEFLWLASADPENLPVTYTLWVDSSSSYGASALSFAAGDGGHDTSYTLTLADINTYIAGLGVVRGSAIDLYWRVVTSDGPNTTASASFGLEVNRELTDFAPADFHLLAPANGTRVVSSPASQDTAWFVWNASIDPEGQPVTYYVEFDTSMAFGLGAGEASSDTVFGGDLLGLDYFLSDLGVAPGDSMVLYWRVTASDEFHQTISLDTYTIMAVRDISAGTFISFMVGSSVIPPAVSNGYGFGSMALSSDSTTLYYDVWVDYLDGDITTSAIHNGAVYENGPAVKDIEFVQVIDEGDTIYEASGFWTSTDGQPLTSALVQELLNRRLYVTVATGAAANGEVRGQVVPDTTMFSFSMAQNLETATGDGLAHLDWEWSDIFERPHRRNVLNRSSAFVRMATARRGIGADPTPIGFNVYRSTDGSEYELLTYTGDTTTAYVDSSVSIGTTYYYTVSAVHVWGITPTSNVASVSPVVPVGNHDAVLPARYDLHANYPNPFNPTTTIRYDLKAETRVTLRVFNLLGQEVRTLVDGRESAGYKMVEWDGKNNHGRTVSTGIYLYRLEAGEFVKTRKMMMLK